MRWVQALVDKHVAHQVLAAADEFGKLPLHHAAEANPHVGSVQLLIDCNEAALGEKCDLEMLPIHWAWCVRLLVSSADSAQARAHSLLHLSLQ